MNNGIPDITGSSADPLAQVRRSPMEMVCDILGVLAEGPTKPTHILYRANMSWKVLSSYLDYLTNRGIVQKEESEGKRSTYTLTQKGRSILELYEGLRQSLAGGTPDRSAPLMRKSTVEPRQYYWP